MTTPKKIDVLLEQLLAKAEDVSAPMKQMTGISTGLYDLDHVTLGLQPGNLTIIAGRPAMGKTALVLTIATHIACMEKLAVGVFSLDLGEIPVALRIAAIAGNPSLRNLNSGSLSDEDKKKLHQTLERLRGTNLFVNASQDQDINELETTAIDIAKQCGRLSLVVVDYIQLFTMNLYSRSQGIADANFDKERSIQLEQNLHKLKLLAVELRCPVVVIWQTGPEVDQRRDKHPTMGDLHLSEIMERDIDLAILMYRDDFYRRENSKEPGIVNLFIPKHRNGPTGSVNLAFHGGQFRLETLGCL